MAIDTPARLAVLGAGPVGLEAALYARFLGYDVVIYERGQIAERVRQAGAAPLRAVFARHRTTLGLAALQAQDPSYAAPPDDAILTCQEWRERYLLPLAATDLLSDHLRLDMTVVGVAFSVVQLDDEEESGEFRVSARSAAGEQVSDAFDGILDCTGLAENPPWSPAEDGGEFFHVLGTKAAGSTDFDMTAGYDQIRAAFRIIGDRDTLDLYASSARLIR